MEEEWKFRDRNKNMNKYSNEKRSRNKVMLKTEEGHKNDTTD